MTKNVLHLIVILNIMKLTVFFEFFIEADEA